MSVYERIETLRKERKISQAKLEKELGFSNGSISKWKTSMPTPERMQKLAEYFHVSVEYLLTGKEDQSNVSEIKDPDLKEEYLNLKNLLLSGKQKPLYFDGKPADQESIELLLQQVLISIALLEKSKE